MTWRGSALLSDDGRHRFRLTRSKAGGLFREEGRGVLFVMLNPSTADAEQDDPTIRRCMGFTERVGQAKLTVVNLFSWRATDPREVTGPDWRDRTGDPQNAAILYSEAAGATTVIVAWGAKAPEERVREVVTRCLRVGGTGPRLYCLGTTKSGAPRHPLYVRADQALEEWDPSRLMGVSR